MEIDMPKIFQGTASYIPDDITEIVLRRDRGSGRWHMRVIATPPNESYIVYDTPATLLDAALRQASKLVKE